MRGMFATRATKKTETHTPIRHCTRTLFTHDRKTTRAAHYLTKDGKREQHEQFIYLTSASTEIQTHLERETNKHCVLSGGKKRGAAALLCAAICFEFGTEFHWGQRDRTACHWT